MLRIIPLIRRKKANVSVPPNLTVSFSNDGLFEKWSVPCLLLILIVIGIVGHVLMMNHWKENRLGIEGKNQQPTACLDTVECGGSSVCFHGICVVVSNK